LPSLVGPVLVRAARRQLRRAATDRIGDLLGEAGVAERPAAIGRRPQRRDEFAVERAAEQRAIGLAARLAAAPERAIDRMLAEQRVGGAVGMRPVTRPAIGARVIDHPGAHRVELDSAAAGEEISLAVDRRGAVAPLPQRPAPPIRGVDMAHVAPAQ
jgi:hypothetical protein